MSENGSRWDVDCIDDTATNKFDDVMWRLMRTDTPTRLFPPSYRTELRDFIIELVAEIERLQTENIELNEGIDLAIYGHKEIRQRLNEIIKAVKA